MAKQPSRDDPSKPKQHGYEYKKQFYQNSAVAADYDEHRFRTPQRMRRNARKWAAIQKALAHADGVKTIVDLPCGTGRFTGHLARAGYTVVGNDPAARDAPEFAQHASTRARIDVEQEPDADHAIG